jgi:hypothetical protein
MKIPHGHNLIRTEEVRSGICVLNFATSFACKILILNIYGFVGFLFAFRTCETKFIAAIRIAVAKVFGFFFVVYGAFVIEVKS